MPLSNRLAAEFFGAFWLVLGGCAVLAAAFPGQGIGAIVAAGVVYRLVSGERGKAAGIERPADASQLEISR